VHWPNENVNVEIDEISTSDEMLPNRGNIDHFSLNRRSHE